MQGVLPKAGLAHALAGLLGAGVALAVALALVLGGGTSATHSHAPATVAPGSPPPPASYDGTLRGAPLQRARCAQWSAASPGERLNAVRGIASTIGGASTTGGVGTTLSEPQALALFDRVCATAATRNFTLYLIYAKAAAFSRVHVSR